ncbi:uncharacterized protein MELLADRAFT_76276 [Melampsora larici-populina 98AG31]|uniref:Uncharacterized protein n=1 Tax=Melampsora larici-populina (strain 98AG31 / pathotype 3-4-7) TaxID=747676 RepID=F4R3M5_MELLP|nr:uncharacterized protein MELLADRAFT_76276 [Melampsora larici-populina 98AG31]EGG12655.1 hypothetical protein MELLADRAFT_76276 [Melampsora larici-populina 98AG31]
MARPGIIQQCFQGEARGPYEVVYFCLACETHRTMKPESIQGHKKLESHIASFAHWSARRDKEASESVGLKDDSVQDKSISESHSTGHPGNNTLKRTDQIDQLESEDVKRRRTLDNLNSRSPFPKITPPISRRSLYRTSSLRKPSSPSNTGETSGKAQETALVEGQSKLHDQASGQQGQTEEPSNQAATATSAPDQSSTPHRESSFSLDFEGTDGIDSDLEDHHEIDSSTDDGLAGVPLPPRYTPTASSRLASTHDNESRLRIFNQIANATGLDEHHLELGRRLCDVTGPEFQFMMSMITSLSTRQEILSYHDDITRQISEIRGGSNGIPTSNGWVESLELRVYIFF